MLAANFEPAFKNRNNICLQSENVNQQHDFVPD